MGGVLGGRDREVAVDGQGELERFVRALTVVGVQVAVDVVGKRGPVVDLVAVEVLVLERFVEALDHAVRSGRATPGADVAELRPACDVAREAGRAVARPVV